MTKSKFQLTEDQRSSLTNCLQIARRKFERNMKSCDEIAERSPEVSAGSLRIGEQFARQAEETAELIARIENAEYIEFGPSLCDQCGEKKATEYWGYEVVCVDCFNSMLKSADEVKDAT